MATLQPYVDDARRLVYDLQEQTGLEDSMRLVVEAGTNQLVFASQVQQVQSSTDFGAPDDGEGSVALRVRPLGRGRAVILDPQRKSGQPVVRSVPTEVLAELVRAGDPVEWVAEQYELTLDQVLDALEYERRLVEAA